MQTNPLKLFVYDHIICLQNAKFLLNVIKSTAKSKNKKLEITIYK
jgi:hypothetical protein